MSVAAQLGIAHLLTLDPIPGSGVTGEKFPVWSYGEDINAYIIIEDPDAQVWEESVFPMRPGFAEPVQPADPTQEPVEVIPLLGRADFFMAFTVAIDEVGQLLAIEPR